MSERAITRHFRTLDAMRGVAALAVVVMHASALFSTDWCPRGYLAVDLFFALSGFVIAYAYRDRLDGGLSPGRFLVMRLVRLYPLYILGVGLGAAVYLGGVWHAGGLQLPSADFLLALAAALVMLPSPTAIGPVHWYSPLNIPGWSLAFEVGANFLLALIWTRLSPRPLVLLIVTTALLLAGQYLLIGDADVGARWSTAIYGVPRTAFSFLLGVALERLPRPAERCSDLALLLPLLLVATFLPGDSIGRGYEMACVYLVFPALLYAGAIVEPRSSTGFFSLLGTISFAIYALHNPLLPLGNTLLAHLAPAPGLRRTVLAAVFVVLLAVLAWVADRVCDRPVRKVLGRRLVLPRTAAA